MPTDGNDLRICIVSGADEIRLRSYINHTIYCRTHDLDYRLDCTLTEGVKDKFLLKQAAVLRLLPDYDWVAWVDDDCYITDFDRDNFRRYAREAEAAGKFHVIARGVEEPQGFWSYVNAGVFMVKSCPTGFDFLQDIMAGDPQTVVDWWDAEKFGMCNGGYDQDVMTWLMATKDYGQGTLWADHREWNSRYHYYTHSLKDAFICHFAGFPDKKMGVVGFANRYGVGQELVPEELLDRFHVTVRSPMGRAEQRVRMRVWQTRGQLKPYLKPIRDRYRAYRAEGRV